MYIYLIYLNIYEHLFSQYFAELYCNAVYSFDFSLSRSPMYGKCTRSEAGTSSQLVTVSGSSMKINLANSIALKVCLCTSIISGMRVKEGFVKNSQKKGARDK